VKQGNDICVVTTRDRTRSGSSGHKRSVTRLVSTHPRVKKIAYCFEFLEAFDDEFRCSRAGSGLHVQIRKTKPALNNSGLQMNVLDSRVREIDFPAKQDADLHVNAFGIESISQGVITEIQVRQRENNSGPGEDGADNIVLPKRGIRTFELQDLFSRGFGAHVLPNEISGTVFYQT